MLQGSFGDAATIDDQIVLDYVSVGSDALDIADAALAIELIRRVTRRQDLRAAIRAAH